MDLELKEKVVIVTGASRGLGAAITKYLSDEGAYVLAAARSESDLRSLQQYNDKRILPVCCDMSVKEEVSGLADMACTNLETFTELLIMQELLQPRTHWTVKLQ